MEIGNLKIYEFMSNYSQWNNLNKFRCEKEATSRGVKNRRPNSFREETASFSSGTHLRF
jgi:hypothetical protein